MAMSSNHVQNATSNGHYGMSREGLLSESGAAAMQPAESDHKTEDGEGKKRKRASQACKECNQRKTKCDISETWPCSKCQKANRSCEYLTTKRGKYDRSHLRAGAGSTNSTTITAATATAPVQEDFSTTSASPSTSITSIGRNAVSYDNTDRPAILSGFDLLLSTSRDPSVDIKEAQEAYVDHTDHHIGTAESSHYTPDDLGTDFSYPSLGVPFPSHPLNSLPYKPQQTNDDRNEWTDLMALHPDRLAKEHSSQNCMFASDSFTLSNLLRRYWNSQPTTTESIPKKRVHFPGGPSFTPVDSEHIYSQEAAELAYLAQVGCFTLPPKTVLDNLISAYFTYFHPVYPVLSKSIFDNQYSQVMTGGVPMLQIWGMLYVSCTLCELSDLLHAGFSTRFEALRSFCMRGKALYNASFERDRVMAVLFEFHVSQVWSDGEDSNVWAARASSSAQSIGMHRSTADSKLVDADRHLWKRIWWAVYIRDRHSSAATGRPYRIHDDFSDVELPEREDFESDREHLIFFANVGLAQILTYLVQYRLVVGKRDKAQEQADCHQRFLEWFENLPKSLSVAEASTDFFVAYLHISYHCWIIHLFRPESDSINSGNAMASQSAAAATRFFEDLLQQNKVGRSPQLVVTALFAAMAQHIHDRHSSDITTRTLSHPRLAICRLAAKELAAMRPVAAWFRRTFASLSFDTQTPALEELAKPAAEPTGTASTGFGQPFQGSPSGGAASLSDIFLSDAFWGMPNEDNFDWLVQQLNGHNAAVASADVGGA